MCPYCMFVQGSTENQFDYWVDTLIKNYDYNYTEQKSHYHVLSPLIVHLSITPKKLKG